MIQVIVKKKNEDITGFHIEGHAEFADEGRDIVCSAVSTLAVNCANSIEEFTEDTFREEMDEEKGMVDFELTGTVSEQSGLLLKSMVFGIEKIAEQYGGKYVQIISR